MKVLDYIKNKSQKSLFIGFIALVVLSFFPLVFPGYTDVIKNNTSEPLLINHVAGRLFYFIGLGVNSSAYISAYNIIESVFSIIFLVLYFGGAIATIILYCYKKKILPMSCTFAPLFFITIIYFQYVIQAYNSYFAHSYYSVFAAIAFLFIFSITAITIDIVRLVHYVKTHPRQPRAPRPPRPRKPSSKKRIAELEARVKELENR